MRVPDASHSVLLQRQQKMRLDCCSTHNETLGEREPW
jgi:hypothetical protein